MKLKYGARLIVEKQLPVAISSITPRFDKICANSQAHPSQSKTITKCYYSFFLFAVVIKIFLCLYYSIK